ncbi:MAG: plasmid mobilization relaxosome protein MobC [Rhodobacter sp.]|nr:plasmid mobilization relaxosome protein MobC [Rhodobacter sp.]
MTKRPIGKREAPFSLRLSFEERAKLEQNAGSMPLSAYIKSLLFADDAPTYRQRRRTAEADEQLLAELLACLGASRLSNNLNQLAKAANSGSLYFDADTKADIKRACDDVRAMRLLLMQALGIKVEEEPRVKESTSQTFTRAASAKPTFRSRRPTP